MPGVWFHGVPAGTTKNRLSICSAVNGRGNFCVNSDVVVPLAQWTTIEISQGQVSKTSIRQYRYTVRVGNSIVFSVINKQPRYFNNVQVFGSNIDFNAAQGSMKNLMIIPNTPNTIADQIE